MIYFSPVHLKKLSLFISHLRRMSMTLSLHLLSTPSCIMSPISMTITCVASVSSGILPILSFIYPFSV